LLRQRVGPSDRADHLVAELLKATTDTMAAKEATAWLEGELAALRSRPETLQAEIARLETTATSRGTDFERERDRSHLRLRVTAPA
jgi:hypothetical protein